jgi:hypothetical protein
VHGEGSAGNGQMLGPTRSGSQTRDSLLCLDIPPLKSATARGREPRCPLTSGLATMLPAAGIRSMHGPPLWPWHDDDVRARALQRPPVATQLHSLPEETQPCRRRMLCGARF